MGFPWGVECRISACRGCWIIFGWTPPPESSLFVDYDYYTMFQISFRWGYGPTSILRRGPVRRLTPSEALGFATPHLGVGVNYHLSANMVVEVRPGVNPLLWLLSSVRVTCFLYFKRLQGQGKIPQTAAKCRKLLPIPSKCQLIVEYVSKLPNNDGKLQKMPQCANY